MTTKEAGTAGPGPVQRCEADGLAAHFCKVFRATVLGRDDEGVGRDLRLGVGSHPGHPLPVALPPATETSSPARARMVTTPVLPFTRSRSPVCTTLVPMPVATTAGSSYSRETIAACDMMPPPSETAAAMRAKTIDQLGAVSGQTRISPSSRVSSSSALWTTRATPSASPGEAARPMNSSFEADPRSAASQRLIVSVLMPKRVTVIGSVTRSGGTPSATGGLQASRAA